MDNIKKELLSNGWHLSDEGLAICKEELDHNQQTPSPKEITKWALNVDLTEIGGKVFPEDLNKGKIKEFKGPCVLQVVRIRNASAPKANEKSTVAPRMLQVHLTDGHKTGVALEHGSFQNKLSLETPPGSKIRINGLVEVRGGFLLLSADQFSLLGGKVESIYNKWIVTKDAGGFSRTVIDVDEAPPPFVPFGNEISSKYNTSMPSLQKSSAKQGKEEEDNKEFTEQRHAAIAEVRKNMPDVAGKTFANGKARPVAEPSSATFKKEVFRHDRKNTSETQQSSQAIYRKPGAFKVDENTCSTIIQMGFSREKASDALRQHNNNLERALEYLLGASSNQVPHGQAVLRPARNDSVRGGRSDRRGRGRGQSNRKRGDDDDDNPHHSSNATLFDFLETKIAPAPKSNAKDAPSTSAQCSTSNGELDDEALQEESILEYVKKLSMVETRGGSPARQARPTEDPQNNAEKTENSGVARYRGGGGASEEKTSGQRQDDRRSHGKDQSSHNRPRYKERRNEHNSDRKDTREDNHNPNQRYHHSSQNSYSEVDRGGRKERKSFVNDRPRNHSNDYHEDFDRRERGDNRRRPQRDADDSVPAQSFDGYDSHRNNRGERPPRRPDGRKPHYDHPQEVPPRFLKKQMQEARQAIRHPKPPVDDRNDQSDRTAAAHHKKGLTLGETARQLDTEANSSSARAHPMNPAHESHQIVTRQTHPSSHSYQDQRQQVRSQFPDNSYGSLQPNREHAFWRPGMICEAKYWEDNRFYLARVEDVHHQKPTAVVTFVEYGNSEEVVFADMQPLGPGMSGPPRDNGSYAGPTGGLEFTRGHKGPTRYPNDEKERRRNVRDAQPFYKPPRK